METQFRFALGPMSALIVSRTEAGSAKPPIPETAERPMAARLPKKNLEV